MNKISFLLISALCACLSASAQQVETHLLKNNGREVNSRDSADYVRVIKVPEEGSKLFSVSEYYINGNKKSIGYSIKAERITYEGKVSSFFSNGKMKRVANYKEGFLDGIESKYFPNGKEYSTIIYDKAKSTKYIKSVSDSTGKVLVADGNGSAIFYDADFKKIIERGKIKDGIYDGDWRGEYADGKLRYVETYANGKFVSGDSMDDENRSYHYTVIQTDPQFEGGSAEFSRFLVNNIKYPNNCLNKGIQGKVFVSFTVRKDGTLEEFRVERSPDPELSVEALRVVKKSPAWIPGVQRGRKVKVRYNVAVNFAL